MVSFTEHASRKIEEELIKFKIAEESVIETLNNPGQTFYDTQTERYIAIDQDRKIAVVYEKSEEDTLIITIIYSSSLDNVIERRRRSGRWI